MRHLEGLCGIVQNSTSILNPSRCSAFLVLPVILLFNMCAICVACKLVKIGYKIIKIIQSYSSSTRSVYVTLVVKQSKFYTPRLRWCKECVFSLYPFVLCEPNSRWVGRWVMCKLPSPLEWGSPKVLWVCVWNDALNCLFAHPIGLPFTHQLKNN